MSPTLLGLPNEIKIKVCSEVLGGQFILNGWALETLNHITSTLGQGNYEAIQLPPCSKVSGRAIEVKSTTAGTH